MRLKRLLTFASVTVLILSSLRAGAQERESVYRSALDLYENGSYSTARTMFASLGDPLSEAYALLCAIKNGDADYPRLYAEYNEKYPEPVLGDLIRYAYATDLFDKGNYDGASQMLSQVSETRIGEENRLNYRFRRGYCAFACGRYDEAIPWLVQVEAAPKSSLTAPSRYQLGYIAYSRKNFSTAEKWFRLTEQDERFKSISEYYILECRFMSGDYDYITTYGPGLLALAPEERKPRLARILSESYLVSGDKKKALEFFEMEQIPENPNRADLFHAGSVKYAVQDYRGAIENFSRMEDRVDSLGQVANYELGYSYIRTSNKVAAAEAFRDAALLKFNPEIREDAWFNHAKLAFDLNSDVSVFGSYLQQYPGTARKEQIYNYLAIAALNSHDYAAAIEAYENIDELNAEQQGNYMKANYLRAAQLVEGGSFTDAVPYFKASAFYLPKQDPLWQLSRYWLAESYFNSGDYASAAPVYEDLYNISALNGRKESAALPYNVGYAYFNQEKYENAARWFDIYKEGADDTFRKDALTRRADCDFARHNYKEAISSYEKVMGYYSDVNDIYPYYQQALAYGLSGKKKEKVSVLSKVLNASSDSPYYSEAMYELGRAYMDIDDNTQAVNTFSALQTTTSDHTYSARALIGQGMAFRNMKNYEKALQSYKSVVDMMPDSEYAEEALMAINSIYQTTNHPEKFLEYVQSNNLTVGKSAAEKEYIYFNTAEQIYLNGSYERAVGSLQKYLNDYPKGEKRGDAWFYLADSYRNLSDKEKACTAFKQAALELKEGSFAETAAYNYAKLSYELQRYNDAYEGYSMLLDIAKMEENKGAARLGKMRSAYLAHNYEDAIAASRDLVMAGPSVAEGREASFTEARSLLATSHREEAYAIFKLLSKQASTPEGAESYYMLVRDYCDSGEFDKLEQAVYEFAGKCGDQTYWLAKCYIVLGDGFREQGNDAQARATWESIRDGYTPSSDKDDILETVNQRIAAL